MKVTVRRPHRRDFLKATGLLGLVSTAGIGSARTSKNGNGCKADDTLRLLSEVAVNGAQEVATEKTWAYVATCDGFAVVDWRNPNRPNSSAYAPGTGIADVKIGGDLFAVSTQGSEHDHGPSEAPDVDPRRPGRIEPHPGGRGGDRAGSRNSPQRSQLRPHPSRAL